MINLLESVSGAVLSSLHAFLRNHTTAQRRLALLLLACAAATVDHDWDERHTALEQLQDDRGGIEPLLDLPEVCTSTNP